MTNTLIDKLTATDEDARLFEQERAILDFTELVCDIMQDAGISRKELAERLGKGKGHITQLLDGRANMTIRTMSDIFVALERSLHFRDNPLAEPEEPMPQLRVLNDIGWSSLPKDRDWLLTLPSELSYNTNSDRMAG